MEDEGIHGNKTGASPTSPTSLKETKNLDEKNCKKYKKGRENQQEELEKKKEETERKFVVRPGKGKKERAVRENLLRKQEKKTK